MATKRSWLRRQKQVERRHCGGITPLIFMVLENIMFVLLITLLNLKDDPRELNAISYALIGIFFLYSLLKTIHVYRRRPCLEEED